MPNNRNPENDPSAPSSLTARQIAREAFLLRISGASLEAIADKLQRNKSTILRAIRKYERSIDRETIEEMRRLHWDRLEHIYLSLGKGIRAGNPRSAEVAIKALEREATLFGLDAKDEEAAIAQPPIQILIQPASGDTEAARIIGGNELLLGRTERPSQVRALQPPAPDPVEPADDHEPVGRDRGREDVAGAAVVLVQAPRP